MPSTIPTYQHWSKLKCILINFDIYLKYNLRLFIEVILYRIRIGCPWRDIPEVFGNPNSIFKKFNRWCIENKLIKIFKLLSSEADLELNFMDMTHVRVHQHSAGIEAQSIYKSISGNNSRIYLAVHAHVEILLNSLLVMKQLTM